ncbi:MAG: hypothetical protein V2A73_04765, partial [Pseudomonadota bacterium]
EDRPQVILCDLHMPVTNGVEFRSQVMARWPELQDRFVFISGTEALTDEARLHAPGCPLVSKPFSTSEVELAIFSVAFPEATSP